MIISFIQTTALILTLAGSYFLLKVNLGLTPGHIAKLSLPEPSGHNKEILYILAKQSTHSYIGFILLLCSFVLQMVCLIWPMSFNAIGSLNRWGILISILFCAIVLIFVRQYSIRLSEGCFSKSMKIVRTHSIRS